MCSSIERMQKSSNSLLDSSVILIPLCSSKCRLQDVVNTNSGVSSRCILELKGFRIWRCSRRRIKFLSRSVRRPLLSRDSNQFFDFIPYARASNSTVVWRFIELISEDQWLSVVRFTFEALIYLSGLSVIGVKLAKIQLLGAQYLNFLFVLSELPY